MSGQYLKPRKKLTDEVSVQEMLEYRQQGLKNSEIAELLDVSYRTIYNYIGSERKRTRKKDGPVASVGEKLANPVLSPEDYVACKAHVEAKKVEAESKSTEKPAVDEKGQLKITSMVMDFSGAAGCYRADQEKKEITLGISTYSYDKLDDLIADLLALKKTVHA
jgi:hypothetical protein